jgi:hypothetical protein
MAIYGFHPHHEGLMLATLNLTAEALRSGAPLPFNQYGHLWALPYLSLELLSLDGFTFLAQRLLSIVMIFLSALMLYRLSLAFQSKRTSLYITYFFLLSYPYGQPSIIWPSVPAQLALIVLAFSIIKATETKRQVYLFLAGFSTVYLIGSRVQIGLVALICTIVILSFTKQFRCLLHYIISISLIFTFLLVALIKLEYLKDVFFDSFIFPLTYLDNNSANWTFPKSSIVFAIALFLLYFSLSSFVHTKNILNLAAVLYTLILLSFFTIQLLEVSLFLKLYARTFVGLFFITIIVVIIALIQELRCTRFTISSKGILFVYSLIGAIQIFPLFDVFHAWYASVPAIVALPLVVKSTKLYLNVNRNFIVVGLTSFMVTMTTIFTLQFLHTISADSAPFPQSGIQGLRLSTQQAKDLTREFDFLQNNIPKGSQVLNLCSNANPFFERGYLSTAHRYFIYWASLPENTLRKVDLSQIDYVTTCNTTDFSQKEISELITSHFTKIETRSENSFWGVSWEIYKNNSK